VDTAAAAQFDSFLDNLARRVADNAERPHHVESNFFPRFENEPVGKRCAARREVMHASLRISPDQARLGAFTERDNKTICTLKDNR
jgi:hypothetical protein